MKIAHFQFFQEALMAELRPRCLESQCKGNYLTYDVKQRHWVCQNCGKKFCKSNNPQTCKGCNYFSGDDDDDQEMFLHDYDIGGGD